MSLLALEMFFISKNQTRNGSDLKIIITKFLIDDFVNGWFKSEEL